MTRIGIAIGCGGTIGGAWATAALMALAEELDWDPRNASLLQGTSAGAQIVTQLAGGYSISQLAAMQAGSPPDDVLREHLALTPRTLPPRPSLKLTCPEAVFTRGVGPHAVLSALAPRGRGDTRFLTSLAQHTAGPDGWLAHPGARLVAFEPATGTRMAFGAPDALTATVDEALRASWAVPGWMPPVVIADRTFIDGGVASTASVDLIDPSSLDVLYVIAPMASDANVRAPGLGGMVERTLLRQPMSRVLHHEIAGARAQGLRVIAITPNSEDMAALGWNFMSRGRRQAAFTAALVNARRTVWRTLQAQETSA
ncbi:patatin [Gordonia oryzae]|uniref:Patatin n=1 Tax=Gordonia oryzae TaxID=2487349 RepID=A0A3N4GK53_9ACTN|nr:patatin-like phospholipase family protein [Gordonia oryzae]RPA59030.1 patatin [Gordonia oryzae]